MGPELFAHADGHRTNVETFIRRIRGKFREVDGHLTRSRPSPDSDPAGANPQGNRPSWSWAALLRAFATKLIILIVIFVTVPVIVYQQLRAADEDQRALLLDGARQQGRMMAEILRPRLGRMTPKLGSELTEALGSLEGVAIKVKLLFRPRNAAAADNFFYVFGVNFIFIMIKVADLSNLCF